MSILVNKTFDIIFEPKNFNLNFSYLILNASVKNSRVKTTATINSQAVQLIYTQ